VLLCSYCYPISWEWLTFATAIPKASLSWEAVFWPYSQEVWVYTVVSILLAMLVTWGSEVILRRMGAQKELPWTAAEFVFGTFLEQSFRAPSATSLRVFASVWLIFGIVLGTGYKSKLVTGKF